ncbi:Hypothetical protein, putative [Bodo saltans]|uniref:Uncharacterized protein n=1 Tax=Bodo saltans TaxID=75058 RepID=A0A0S4IWQ1_BODSA|nr:Hypothetical protein, putative [Bodo saltans]|eukprot:CUG06446.1 Hypothetical protein, putative [Bodo saltans]
MARHAQEMFRTTEQDDRYSVVSKGHADPTELSLSPLGHTRTRKVNLHVQPPGVQEFYDELNAKVSEAAILLNKFRANKQEVTTKLAALKKTEAHVASQEKHLAWMNEQAKWRSSQGPRNCPMKVHDEQSDLQQRVRELSETQRTLEKDITHQATRLGTLRDKVDETPAFEEELRQLKTEVAVLGLEDSSVQDEINANLRLLKRKDRLHTSASTRSTLPEMRDLDATKRVTQSKLSGHREQVRINEAAIQHRTIMIARLQQRLETIGDALLGDDTSNAHERVDATLLESLRKETEILTRDRIDNDARIAALDGDYDQLANRKRILQNALRVVEEEEGRRRKEHDKYTRLVDQQRDNQRASTDRTLHQLEDEVATLRSETGSQRRSRSNPSSSEQRQPSPDPAAIDTDVAVVVAPASTTAEPVATS